MLGKANAVRAKSACMHGVERFEFVLEDQLSILVVDDDPIQREFSAVYLAAPHVEVIQAECAQDGLALLASRDFDIALIDYEMPNMDGIEMLHRIRGSYPTLPVIMITGREDTASIDRAYDAGATSFMSKPINWRLLSYQIRFVMRAHVASLRGST